MRSVNASVLAAPIVIALLFGSCLIGLDRLAFRDVSHFYTPLYQYVAERQAESWIPLWNPLDHTGIPLVGETTTAVFYPLRWLIYALPLSAATAMSWYVAVHLVIASLASFWCARWNGVSVLCSSLASVAYTTSGTILFLYCNPPFLVSAAWLPLVIGSLVSQIGPSSHRRIAIASTALAMMVLGGDPQTGLHSMLVAVVIWLLRFLTASENPVRLSALLIVPLIATALAFPQIAASIDWSRQSDRIGQSRDGLLSPPVVGSRKYEAYQFSLAPWHTLELASPAPFGSLFPINQRLSRLIPGDGRMWTPSIYMGILVAATMLLRLKRWRRGGIDVWTVLALLSIMLAMGQFGLVWWIQNSVGGLSSWDSAAGGPYWMMYHFLPGYDAFRYPAKWLPLFALGASIATAKWIDDEDNWAGLRSAAIGIMIAFLIAAIAALIWQQSITLVGEPELPNSAKDEFWGPLRLADGIGELAMSFAHTTIFAGLIALLFRLRRTKRLDQARVRWGLLGILLIDVAIAANANIQHVSIAKEQQAMQLAGDKASGSQIDQLMRTQSDGGWPEIWSETSAMHRALEVESSCKLAIFGRWHLANGQRMFNSMTSIRSKESDRFWSATRELQSQLPEDQRRLIWPALQRWLSINHIVHVTSASRAVEMTETPLALADVTIQPVDAPLAKIRSNKQWTVVSNDLDDRALVTDQLRTIVENGGEAIPVLQLRSGNHVVESRRSEAETASVENEVRIETRIDEPERCLVNIRCQDPILLTRTTFQDGNWSARRKAEGDDSWEPVEVHRVDLLRQGVVVPRGTFQLEFRYHPWWLTPSVALSVLAWFAVAATTFQYRTD